MAAGLAGFVALVLIATVCGAESGNEQKVAFRVRRAECDGSEIMKCVEAMATVGEQMQGDNPNVDQICPITNQMYTCLDEKTAGCSDQQKSEFNVDTVYEQKSTFDQLCGGSEEKCSMIKISMCVQPLQKFSGDGGEPEVNEEYCNVATPAAECVQKEAKDCTDEEKEKDDGAIKGMEQMAVMLEEKCSGAAFIYLSPFLFLMIVIKFINDM